MTDTDIGHDQLKDAQDGKKEPTGRIKHKTLSAYYPQITTLRTYLSPIIHVQRDLDPPEYLQLLDECLVCSSDVLSSDLGCLRGGESSTGLSQQEAIDRILSDVSRKDNGRNVLLFGLRANYAAGELPINTHRPAFENRHANSPSAVLRSLAWKILRTRIGDTAFRDLLVQHSLFVLVGNNCYIQLSGTPIFDLYQHQGIITDLQPATGKRYRTEDHGRRARKRQKKTKAVQPEDRRDAYRVNGKDSSKGTADRLVLRGKMFYGQPKRDHKGRLRHGLPAHHSLNKLQPKSSDIASDAACISLAREILPSMFTGSDHLGDDHWPGSTFVANRLALRGSKRRLSAIMGIMRELLARHTELDYAGLARRCQNRQPGRVDGMEPVTHRSVYRFIAAVVKGLFTPNGLGSEHNQTVLLGHIRMLIEMRQHEVTSLHTLMQGFRVNDVAWLASSTADVRIPPREARRRRVSAEDLVYWIINDFVLPLIKNTFYVTETAATRYETVYFLHDDWEKATKPHLRQLELELLEELSPVSVPITYEQAYFAKQGPLGVSAVRLVPKPHQGFRPIVNLGKRLKTGPTIGVSLHGSNKAMTANQVLRGVHQVLTFEKERHRDQMGCTLFGTNEVFGPIQTLKRELLSKHNSMPRLYFVKMDIKSAYDTIKQDKMMDIVSDLLERNHDYCLLLYSLLLPPASKASQGSARRLFKTKAMINDGHTNTFGQHAKIIAQPMRNAVMVDMMRRKHMTREDCLKLLMTHIKDNVWEVDGKSYRQKTGIPQGSKISSLLCSFFYAVLERKHLGFVNQTGSRLLRYIDDFLFISDDLSLARRFVQRMQAGFPEYGAFVAQGKTLLSFEYASGSQVNPVCLGSDGKEYFPYCGFLIDTGSLDMSMDYARAMSTHIKQSFALRSHRRKGSAFLGWFSRQLENRNYIAYLDSQHNDAKTVRLNVFLNFALTSMKIPHYFKMTGEERLSDSRANMIAESLILAMEYTYVAGRARVKHASRDDKANEHYSIGKLEFSCIALAAMIKVFTKKASQYKRVLSLLRVESEKDQERLKGDARDVLVGVIEEGWQAVKNTKY